MAASIHSVAVAYFIAGRLKDADFEFQPLKKAS